MYSAVEKGPAFLAVILLVGGCSETGTVAPDGGPPARRPDRKVAPIAWGTPVDGIQVGITPVSCSVQGPEGRPVGCCESVGITIRNVSHELPAGCDGSVRLAVWQWRVGKVAPGTAGGMGVTGPVDPTVFPLKKKLLDGKVHQLESYLLPCGSIHPQQTMTGTFTVTFYFTDSRGRPLGGKWRGKLQTGSVAVRYYRHVPAPDPEAPKDEPQSPRAPSRGVLRTELPTHSNSPGLPPCKDA